MLILAGNTVNLPATLADSQWELSDLLGFLHFNEVHNCVKLDFFLFKTKMWRRITGVKRTAETNNQQKDEDEKKKSKRYFKTKWTIGGNGKVHERLIYDSNCCFVTFMRSERRTVHVGKRWENIRYPVTLPVITILIYFIANGSWTL